MLVVQLGRHTAPWGALLPALSQACCVDVFMHIVYKHSVLNTLMPAVHLAFTPWLRLPAARTCYVFMHLSCKNNLLNKLAHVVFEPTQCCSLQLGPCLCSCMPQATEGFSLTHDLTE